MLSHYPHRRKRKYRRLNLLLTQHIILLSIEDEGPLKGFYSQFRIIFTDPNDPYYSSFIIFNFVQIASSKSPQKLEQSNLRLSPNKVNLLSPGSNKDVQSFHDLHSQYKLRNIKQIKSAGQSLIRKSVDDKECDLGDFIQENVSAQQIKSIPTHERVVKFPYI